MKTTTTPEQQALAKSMNVPISTKHSVEISNHLRYKTTSYAKQFLTEVVALRSAVPCKRFINDLGHKPGIGPGRYPKKAAAEFLTPTTLELGGKSPCIVDGTAPIQKTARRIIWGKFLNCGQTCIAPDYVLVKKEHKNELVAAMIQEIEKAFGKEAQLSKDYGRIIHQKHFEKLVQDLNKQTLLYGGDKNKEDLFFGPTLVDEPELDSSLLMDEIFGPILPILSYNTEADLDLVLTKLKNPLAFYIFSSQKKFINALVQRYAFGGGVINDSIIHFTNDKLPFGGVGNSGMGAYHGKYSYDVFTHAKPVVKRSFWFDLPQRYAPYPKSLKSLKFLLKKL